MLLVASTVEYREDEAWFLDALLKVGLKNFQCVTVLGFSGKFKLPPNCFRLPYSWDVEQMLGRWRSIGIEGSGLSSENLTIWARRLVGLRHQGERCYLSPSSVIEEYSASVDRLLDLVAPQAALITNPSVVHTGIIRERLALRGVSSVVFERGPLRGSFELDEIGCGVHHSLAVGRTEEKRQVVDLITNDIPRSLVVPSDSRQASGLSTLAGDGQIDDATLGVLGADDTSAGTCARGPLEPVGFPSFGETSFDVAVDLALAVDSKVAFKPHPVSIHLVSGRVVPDNMSVVLGSLGEFCQRVGACAGLGSTADGCFIYTGKPYVLVGRSVLSGTGLVREARTAADVALTLSLADCRPNPALVNAYLSEIVRKYGITQNSVDVLCSSLKRLRDEAGDVGGKPDFIFLFGASVSRKLWRSIPGLRYFRRANRGES